MRALFVAPPYHAGVVEVAGRWVPLYFVYLAGALRAAGHDPLIYDAMTKFVGHEEIEAKIRETSPGMVCTSAMTCSSPDAIEVMETAKRVDPEIITVCGGVHPSFMYEEMFSLTDSIDYIVVGEGEVTIAELTDALEQGRDPAGIPGLAFRRDGKTVVTGQREFIKDLDSLTKAWDLLDWEDYTYFIIPGSRLGAVDNSRGCDQDCTFCSQQKLWRQTWRGRSPEGIVADMREQQEKYGVDVVLFTDEYSTPNRERWESLLDLLIKEDLGIKILMETRASDIVRDKDIIWKYKKY